MRRTITSLALVVSFAAVAQLAAIASPMASAPARVWRIDPARSEVRFTVTKFGFEDVTGVFRESEGEIQYDPVEPAASTIQWRVRVASVLTDASNRDQSLQGPEYFDAGRHPYLTFASRSVRPRPDRSLEVSGDFTIRGVTRRIDIHARPQVSAAGLAFETDFNIDRYDYGVAGGSVMGRLIGRQVRIHLMVVAVPRSES
jgi:polyisoprenoid-binding protein YceI